MAYGEGTGYSSGIDVCLSSTFSAASSRWLREGLREQVTDTLGERGLARRGLLRPKVLAGLVDDHLSGRRERGMRLWTLLVLELWFRSHAPEFSLD